MSNDHFPKKKKRQIWVVMTSTIAVCLIASLIVGAVFQNKSATPSQEVKLDQKKSEQMAPVGKSQENTASRINYTGQPMMGKKDAPVKIAEFGDYKCIYCYQFEMTIFPKLKKDFIDTGKVQYYFMNYTILAQDSVKAANAAEAIFAMYPDRFWTFHHLLYKNQGPETKAWVTDELLLKLADEAVSHLDVSQFKDALEQGTYVNNIKTDVAMGQAAKVEGTPTIFINGKMLPAQDTFDYNQLKKAIQQAMGEKNNDQ